MLTRRKFVLGATLAPFLIRPYWVLAKDADRDPTLDQLEYPDLALLDTPEPFGSSPPTEAQRAKAKEIISSTPRGPTPLAVADSFVTRFFASEPELISQWPAPAAWNPLVVEFFSATSMRPNNDMVAWCAAFANWCLFRADRPRSNSASSQSFLGREFTKTTEPQIGDLAVFTCFSLETSASLGLGHVAFVASPPTPGSVELVGGNQRADGHSSIISRRKFSTEPTRVTRRLNGKPVLCEMRLNTYIRI